MYVYVEDKRSFPQFFFFHILLILKHFYDIFAYFNANGAELILLPTVAMAVFAVSVVSVAVCVCSICVCLYMKMKNYKNTHYMCLCKLYKYCS